MKQRIRLTESDLHRIIKNVILEFKNKDTERFNLTGNKYDLEAREKRNSRDANRDYKGYDRPEYHYHNKSVAQRLADKGAEHQPSMYDFDYISPYECYDFDEEWLNDHDRGGRDLSRRDWNKTIDGDWISGNAW